MSDRPSVEYCVPRNPGVSLPSFRDVIGSTLVSKDALGQPTGEIVRAYSGDQLPPARAALIGRGLLIRYEQGLLFVATRRDAAWRHTLAELASLAVRGAPSAALERTTHVAPATHSTIAKGLGSASLLSFVNELMRHDPVEAQLADIASRTPSRDIFALPFVDLVTIRVVPLSTWGRLRTVYAAGLTLQDASGATRSCGFVGIDAGLADACVLARFEQECLYFAREAWSHLLDLGGLGRALAARYPDIATVVAGRVWDDWKAAVDARIAATGVTQVRVAELTLERMAPSIESYRRIQHVAERLQALEAAARGSSA